MTSQAVRIGSFRISVANTSSLTAQRISSAPTSTEQGPRHPEREGAQDPRAEHGRPGQQLLQPSQRLGQERGVGAVEARVDAVGEHLHRGVGVALGHPSRGVDQDGDRVGERAGPGGDGPAQAADPAHQVGRGRRRSRQAASGSDGPGRRSTRSRRRPPADGCAGPRSWTAGRCVRAPSPRRRTPPGTAPARQPQPGRRRRRRPCPGRRRPDARPGGPHRAPASRRRERHGPPGGPRAAHRRTPPLAPAGAGTGSSALRTGSGRRRPRRRGARDRLRDVAMPQPRPPGLRPTRPLRAAPASTAVTAGRCGRGRLARPSPGRRSELPARSR